ncbi:hypothetical protein [Spiroplasma ixodetis]|uniref:hypothetical protein n=1 Tax=Spiroplasma ixodetis TaxID=2141 RepID=UPI0025781936|nr:hypothetical protein [Spiroplasma ixodetis]
MNNIFASYSQEELKEKWYDVDYYTRKLIAEVAKNQDYYTNDFDKKDYIKTKSIKLNNHNCKEFYTRLRENILIIFKAFLPLCTIFKFYHINVEKSLSTDFSPHF